jgi:hypothetical protein
MSMATTEGLPAAASSAVRSARNSDASYANRTWHDNRMGIVCVVRVRQCGSATITVDIRGMMRTTTAATYQQSGAHAGTRRLYYLHFSTRRVYSQAHNRTHYDWGHLRVH